MDDQEIFEGGTGDGKHIVLADEADYAFSAERGFLNYDRQRLEKERIVKLCDALGMFTCIYLGLRLMNTGAKSAFAGLLAGLSGGAIPTDVLYVLSWLFGLLMNAVVLIVPFAVFGAYIRIPLQVALPLRRPRISLTVLGTLCAVGVSAAVMLMTAGSIGAIRSMTGVIIDLPSVNVSGDALYGFLGIIEMAVMPAVVEELLFRGVIMQSLRQFSDWFALLVSSMLFALIHPSAANLPHAFLLGCVIGYFVLRTGSLITGMVMHFCCNMATILTETFLLSAGEASYGVYLLCMGVFIILGLAALVTLSKNYDDLFLLNRRKGSVLTSRQQMGAAVKSVPFMLASAALLISMLRYVRIR